MAKKKNENQLHITRNHTGKMEDMSSLSTPCTLNERCKRNAQIPGSICEKCYARTLMEFRTNIAKCLERNYNLLTSKVIPIDDLPYLNNFVFRFEAFGDLANTTQAINYLNIIKKNPHCKFGWWTKNPDFIAKAFKATGYTKPKNVQIIRSSMFVNKPCRPGYDFVDAVFTVYDKKYAEEHNIEINCGARHCFTCLKCYTESEGVKYINELKK